MYRFALPLILVLLAVALTGAPTAAADGVDWNDHHATDIELPDGWRLTGCEGDQPALCAYDPEGEIAGTVVFAVYDVWAHEDVSPEAVAEDIASTHDIFEADRLATCGDDYAYEPHGPEAVQVGGLDGYRYGFTLRDGQGQVQEHAVVHLTFAAGMRLVMNTSFIAPEGCPGPDPERLEFDVADMAVMTPHLDGLAAHSILPVDFAVGPACGHLRQAPSAGFTDTFGSIHERAIDCVAWYGLTTGVTAHEFAPGRPVTRAQLATLLVRWFAAVAEDLPDAGDQGFTDVAGNPHADAINRLAAAGVVRGTSPTTFAPSRAVTRAQASALAVRAFELAQGRELHDADMAFADVAGVHAEAISRAATNRLVHGFGGGTFGPHRPVRRDQAAAVLTRMLNRRAWTIWVPPPSP